MAEDTCFLGAWFAPCAFLFSVFAPVFVVCFVRARHADAVSTTQDLFGVYTWSNGIFQMCIIPDSYLLSLALGKDAAWSGFIIGISSIGNQLGSLFMWALLRSNPLLWRWFRSILVASSITTLSMSIVYTICGFYSTRGAVQANVLADTICASRFVMGFGLGIQRQAGFVANLRMTRLEDRVAQQEFKAIAMSAGIGMGVLFAGVIASVDEAACPDPNPDNEALRFETVGYASSATAFLLLLLAAFVHPSLESVADQTEFNALPGAVSEGSIVVAGACLVITGVRAYIVSAVECSTALLLEMIHDWRRSTTGVVISLAFMLGVPLGWFRSKVIGKMKVSTAVCVFSAVGTLSTLLFLQSVPAFFSLPGDAVIVLADCLLFPSMLISDALSVGVMMRQKFSDKSWFSPNNLILLQQTVTSAGRIFSPWLTRWQIEYFGENGQNSYALSQFAACVSFMLMFECQVAQVASKD